MNDHLITADELRLAVRRWEPAMPSRTAVVLVHGFTATKDHPSVVATAEALAGAGYAVLAYDARGHGQSEGECSLGYHESLDVAAAATAARRSADTVIAVGASMGGVAVLRAAASGVPLDGVVTVSSPAGWNTSVTPQVVLASAITQTRPGRWLARRFLRVQLADRWVPAPSPVELVEALDLPVAVVHGRRDRFIRPAEGRRLHAAAGGRRRLELVPGMGHAFEAAGNPAVVRAVAWAEAHAARQVSRSSTSLAR